MVFSSCSPRPSSSVPSHDRFWGSRRASYHPACACRLKPWGERVIGVVFPESVDLCAAFTAQSMHQRETSPLKRARLENGMEAQVPRFVKEGEFDRIEVATGRDLERVKESGKR
jgi:elongation factor P